MDLFDLLKLMFRRWYTVVPILVVTLGAALILGSSIQPEYRTSAAVLLVPPSAPAAPPATRATGQPVNPWLKVGEDGMAQAVQIAVSAYDTRAKVAAAGGDPGYEVGLVTRSSILTVDVTAASRASVLATVTAVTQSITDVVAAQQAPYQGKPGEQITTQVLDPGLNITRSRSNAIRAQVVAGIIGLFVAALAAVVHDAVHRHRTSAQRRRRRARPPRVWPAADMLPGARPATPATLAPAVEAPAVDPRPDPRPDPMSVGPWEPEATAVTTAFTVEPAAAFTVEPAAVTADPDVTIQVNLTAPAPGGAPGASPYTSGAPANTGSWPSGAPGTAGTRTPTQKSAAGCAAVPQPTDEATRAASRPRAEDLPRRAEDLPR